MVSDEKKLQNYYRKSIKKKKPNQQQTLPRTKSSGEMELDFYIDLIILDILSSY